jgi:hypothetical protein
MAVLVVASLVLLKIGIFFFVLQGSKVSAYLHAHPYAPAFEPWRAGIVSGIAPAARPVTFRTYYFVTTDVD